QQPITDEELCQLFARIETARAETSLTYFEMSLLAALLYFKEAYLDVLILEVGMGGRLDATNIIDADLAIVTTVDLDHQDLLGADKEAIGAEKAGIFRKGHLCIYADFSPPSSLLRHAQSLETKMLCLGKDYQFHIADGQLHIQHPFQTDTLVLPLPTLHPHAAVSAVIASLCLQTRLPVSEKDWTTAMQTMRILGRQYWVPGEIYFLYDVAHNPQAATALAQCIEHKLATTEQLSQKTPATPSVIASRRRSNPVALGDAAQGHWPQGKIHAVFSALKDKDICGLIKPLSSIVEQWYPASLRGQRAASQEQLQKAFRDVLGEQPHCYEDPIQATQAAVAAAKPGDWIVVYGSFLLVGAVMTANGQL
ncbi:MAG: Mur ligase family protein, partial [Legionellales bacterium]|nr:Mur ligase family protein [Legionellales bacterium]